MPAKIVIAVDLSEASDKALQEGGRLAQDLGADVVLAHAFEPLLHAASGLSLGARYEPPPTAQVRQAAALALTDTKAQTLRDLGLSVEVVAREGSPEDVVLDAAEANNARLIVMGTHGRRGLERLVLGSVAQSVLQRAERPVVVVPVATP